MKLPIGTNGKCEHSDKDCCCGGHSTKDVKKNKNHNATKKRLGIRMVRKFLNNIAP